MSHFHTLFIEPSGERSHAISRVRKCIPKLVITEYNEMLMRDIYYAKVEEVVHTLP